MTNASAASAALDAGDLAPWFRQRCIGQGGLFSFDMAAGRMVVLCFYGSASASDARGAVALLQRLHAALDPARVALFGVSGDAADEDDPALAPTPELRHFADGDGQVARLYGMAPMDDALSLQALRQGWFVLDTRLRVMARFPLEAGDAVAAFVAAAPAAAPDLHAPVLVIPQVFEPAFCDGLIAYHRQTGGEDSKILTEGAQLADPGFKRRRDRRIADPALVAEVQARILRRVAPELRHAFQFHATHMERLVVAVYDASEGGRFGPHRDNTVRETAHRRFAVSINLNDGFEGGALILPEYGAQRLRPPPGAALVFSCSLMHAVTPMTSGRRYACLPFVYDAAAAALRRRVAGS